MADETSNIIEVVFRAVVDQLKGGTKEAVDNVKAAADDVRKSAETISSSTQSAADAVQKSMGGIGSATEKAAASARAFKSEFQDLKTVQAAIDGTVKSMEELVAVEQAMDRLAAKGMLDAELQAEAFVALEAAEAKIAKSALAAQQAEKKLGDQHAVNGGTARELGVMIGELLRGNYTRLEGSSITLANRSGLLAGAFSAVGLAVTGVVAVVGALVAGYVGGQNETERFNRSIESTGNYAGTSAEQMRQLAQEVAGGSVTIGNASDAIDKMVASGRLNNDQLDLGARFAADWARVTGESADKVAEKVLRLADDPASAIAHLNNQYHLLTESQYEEIAAIQQEQGASAALTAALSDLAQASATRTARMEEHAGTLQRAWEAVKQTISGVKEALLDIGREDGLDQQFAKADARLKELQAMKARGQNTEWGMDGLHNVDDEIAQQEQLINLINDQRMGRDNLAAAESREQQIQSKGVTAAEQTRKAIAQLKDQTGLQTKLNEITERYMALRASNPNSDLLKGVQFDASGKPTGGGNYGDEVAAAKKSFTDRGAERAAHKAKMDEYREELNAIQIERDATQQASQARIDEDQKVVEKALALYGKDSNQYRNALRQKEADEQQYANKLKELDNARSEAHRVMQEMELREEEAEAHALYATHQISAAQLLQIERDLIQKKLAADEAYYEAKKAAAQAAGDDVGAERASQGLMVAQANAHQQMGQAELQYQQQSIQGWYKWSDQLTGVFANVTQGMIFQCQSLRQAFVSAMGQMLSSMIGTLQQMLAKWIATKAAEVSAHVAANTIKVASDKMAAKESVAANAGAAIKKIVANAAEVFTSVYKAIAGIPYVGPFLAPVMAVAAGATVIGMVGKVASAERGWERVPYDGAMTELHKDEQVLPAQYAEGLRRLVEQGGGGDQYHFHVQAFDGRDVKRFFKDHAGTVIEQLGKHGGNFRPER